MRSGIVFVRRSRKLTGLSSFSLDLGVGAASVCATCAVLLSATRGSSSSSVSIARDFDSDSKLLKLPANQYIGDEPLLGRQVEKNAEDSVVAFLLPPTKLKQKDLIQVALQIVAFHLKKMRARSVSGGKKSIFESLEATLSLKPKVRQGKASTEAELNVFEDADTDESMERECKAQKPWKTKRMW